MKNSEYGAYIKQEKFEFEDEPLQKKQNFR